MRRRLLSLTLALVVFLAAAASGCASHAGPGLATESQARPGPADIPRAYAEQLPVGRQVEVRLRSGRRFKATYMGVEGDAVRLQRRGRLPERPELVPLAEVSVLRVAEHNGSAARAVVIGVVSGAAAFFGLLIGSIAAWAD